MQAGKHGASRCARMPASLTTRRSRRPTSVLALEMEGQWKRVASGSSPPCPIDRGGGRSNTRDHPAKPARRRAPGARSHGSRRREVRSWITLAAGNAARKDRSRRRGASVCQAIRHNADASSRELRDRSLPRFLRPRQPGSPGSRRGFARDPGSDNARLRGHASSICNGAAAVAANARASHAGPHRANIFARRA